MKTLQERIKRAQEQLEQNAVPIRGTLGRVQPEEADETRFPFQRDRDRIIHTQSFRRLKGKTQVFVTGEGDHYRTRLTHTMEVAQLSRDIARTLSLNEDLAEAIALAHDLGHPPFGHAGEAALNEWMEKNGSHFEHNVQSYRIVTLLEEHSSFFKGLNLNREVLEGLIKHRSPHDQPSLSDAELRLAGHPAIPPRSLSLEAQIVNIADEIAYTAHDCDDGLKANLFSPTELQKVPLAKEAFGRAESRGTSLRGAIIHLLVIDLYSETEKRLEDLGISSLEKVYEALMEIVSFSPGMKAEIEVLRDFLWKNMYLHPSVLSRSEEGQQVILRLCEKYSKYPLEKILLLQKKTGSTLVEAVKDYIAGMTDEFASKSIS